MVGASPGQEWPKIAMIEFSVYPRVDLGLLASLLIFDIHLVKGKKVNARRCRHNRWPCDSCVPEASCLFGPSPRKCQLFGECDPTRVQIKEPSASSTHETSAGHHLRSTGRIAHPDTNRHRQAVILLFLSDHSGLFLVLQVAPPHLQPDLHLSPK